LAQDSTAFACRGCAPGEVGYTSTPAAAMYGPTSGLRARLLWCFVSLAIFFSVGASTLVYIERENELINYELNKIMYNDMKSMYSFDHCDEPSFSGLGFCKDQETFSRMLEEFFNEHGNSVDDLQKWTPLGAIFFLTQLTTTIGYGNTACQTHLGQMMTIVFLFIGIPLMGYTIYTMAIIDMYVTKSVADKMGVKTDSQTKQAALLACAFGIFLLLGSLVYHMLEGWTYLEALYFSFTTLTTIGFGDYLPTTAASKIFSIFYIILGLGNCASIIALLTVNVEKTHFGLDAFFKNNAACCGMEDDHDSNSA